MLTFLLGACSSEYAVELHALDTSPGCFPSQFEDGLTATWGVGLPVPVLLSDEINTSSVTQEILREIRVATSASLSTQVDRATRLSKPVRENPFLSEWDDSASLEDSKEQIQIRSVVREDSWGVLYAVSIPEGDARAYGEVGDVSEIIYRHEDTLYEFSDSSFLMGQNFISSSALTRGCDSSKNVFFESNSFELDGVSVELTLCWVPNLSLGNVGTTPEEFITEVQRACFDSMDRVLRH
jgi:hypothetical protein